MIILIYNKPLSAGKNCAELKAGWSQETPGVRGSDLKLQNPLDINRETGCVCLYPSHRTSVQFLALIFLTMEPQLFKPYIRLWPSTTGRDQLWAKYESEFLNPGVGVRVHNPGWEWRWLESFLWTNSIMRCRHFVIQLSVRVNIIV